MGQRFRKEPEGQDNGGVASAEQGFVLLDGPNGVAVSLTPDAARATALSLLQAAEEAQRQQSR